MVHHAAGRAARQHLGPFRLQLLGAFEAAVFAEVLGKRAVQSARNVTCHRVQRLHFAPVAGTGTGVDHSLAGLAQVGNDRVGEYQLAQRRLQFELRRGRGCEGA